MSGIALYSLSEAYQNVLSLIDDESPDQDILIALQTIEGQIESKAISIANLIRSLESEADAIKVEEKRLAQRRKSRENAVANIKQYLKVSMEQMGKEEIKTPFFSFKIQRNPPALNITDASLIPQKFLTLVPERYEVRNKDVVDALKAGDVVAGAELKVGTSLRIR